MVINKLKDERLKSIVFLIIASILASTGGFLIKLVDWNPIAISGVRSFIGSITILLYLRKIKINVTKVHIGGSIAYAGTVILFVVANKLTTSANVILLQYTSPIFVALLGIWILNEKIFLYDWVTIFCVLGGMALFFIDGIETGNMLGNVLSIFSGFSFACVTIAFRLQKDGSPVETALLGNIITFLIAIPFIFKETPSFKSIAVLIILGVLQTGLCIILYALAMKHITAMEAVLINVIEPLLNPLWTFLIVGEKPSFYSVIGGIIVILSVSLRGIFVAKKQKSDKEFF